MLTTLDLIIETYKQNPKKLVDIYLSTKSKSGAKKYAKLSTFLFYYSSIKQQLYYGKTLEEAVDYAREEFLKELRKRNADPIPTVNWLYFALKIGIDIYNKNRYKIEEIAKELLDLSKEGLIKRKGSTWKNKEVRYDLEILTSIVEENLDLNKLGKIYSEVYCVIEDINPNKLQKKSRMLKQVIKYTTLTLIAYYLLENRNFEEELSIIRLANFVFTHY